MVSHFWPFCVCYVAWLLKKKSQVVDGVKLEKEKKEKNLPNVAKQRRDVWYKADDTFLMFFQILWGASLCECEPRWFVYFLMLQLSPPVTDVCVYLSLEGFWLRISLFTIVCWKAFQLISRKTVRINGWKKKSNLKICKIQWNWLVLGCHVIWVKGTVSTRKCQIKVFEILFIKE